MRANGELKVLLAGPALAGDKALRKRLSGDYGLVMADGKFVKFDEVGNAKALAALKATSKEKDLKAKVTGTLDGETIQVESVDLQ